MDFLPDHPTRRWLVIFLALCLVASAPAEASGALTRGPYLQMGTSQSMVIRWRTDTATMSRVRYGTDIANLNLVAENDAVTTEHEITIAGLTPDTRYYYAVGSKTATLAEGVEFNFFTPPPIGTGQPTRIWVLGDSGMPEVAGKIVRDGYTTFTKERYTDVWLMLGDNAYYTGTDPEYQAAVFDVYPGYLSQTPLWPTIGNHDTAFSSDPDIETTPYFNIFTLPTNGEAGGIPSGTEKYYSFDQGRIHFICLDSMTSSRLPGSAMLTWLQTDLESTTQDWIIAYFHHPPYTKGSHNSDTESDLVQIRENILPLLEAGGVDLVLTGHSHCYERSFLIDGHYGDSTTFSNSMKRADGDGREDGDGAYTKPGNLAANQGAVYVVAGNGGHVTGWSNGSRETLNPAPHPAMYLSLLRVGSLVLDISGNRLEAKMIGGSGAIEDHFTLLKNLPNNAPSVSIASPISGAALTVSTTLPITASASDPDGSVAQVDFYAGNVLIGTAMSAPFSVNWKPTAIGTHLLSAAATDNLGATTTSSPVRVNVRQVARPAAPTGIKAVPANASVALSWDATPNALSYTVRRAGVACRPFTTVASGLTSTSFSDTTVGNGTVYYYFITAINAGGESAPSKLVRVVPNIPDLNPAAPDNFAVAAVSGSQARLLWSDNATNETGYRIERSREGGPFRPVANLAPNTTTFMNTGLVPAKSYAYRVRAVSRKGRPAYSNIVTVTMPK